MDYWIYENWTAELKAMVHAGDCSFCNDGHGIHEEKTEGRNGRWHGPFGSRDQARDFASSLGRPVRECNFCWMQ